MKVWKRKILHRHNSGTVVLNGEIMAASGLDGVDAVEVSIVPGGVLIHPVKEGVWMTVAGIDCFTWEDVAWVGKCMHENGYVPDGKGGALAGVMPCGGENGGDVAADGAGGQGDTNDGKDANSSLF